jgi:hypothetical protein
LILKEYIQDIESIKNPIFGFLFSKEKLVKANQKLRRIFPVVNDSPQKDIAILKKLADFFDFIVSKKENFPFLIGKGILL